MQGMVENQLFQPPAKRGRKPLVDIAGVLTTAVENSGQWVSYELPMNKAKSLMRQLAKYDDIEVVSQRRKTDESDNKIVWVRAIEKPTPIKTFTFTTSDNKAENSTSTASTGQNIQMTIF